MDSPPSPHPTGQALSLYGLGKLDREAARGVVRHLEQCPDCRGRVAVMSADSVPDRAGDAGKGSTRSTFGLSLAGGTPKPAARPAPETLPPGLAGHPDFDVRRELGRGGMGVVYLAHNTLMGRDEVLKVMSQHLLDRPGVLERFLREIRAVARLRHPNIVTAYSAVRLGESIVFAMEYVEGLDLAKLVKAKGPLPVAHACNFVHQAALGLQHAHEEGLVHRDIKPGNLMLSRKGEKPVVKVLDFGLAKASREEKVDSGLTSEGQALGTPDFIAPEQILDAPGADIRADIYSLGGTLYYLLLGRPPFKGNSLYDVYQAHISRDADPLNLVRPEVPAELAALVAKMMAKDPSRRFQTPGEVARALEPFFKKGVPGVKPAASARAAGPAAVAPPPARPAGQAAEAPAPEVRWESLVGLRETERSRAPATVPQPPPALPGTRAPSNRPPRTPGAVALAAAAGFLGLVALGVVITIRFKDGREARVSVPGDVQSVTTEVKPDDTAATPASVPARTAARKAFALSGSWTVEGDELVQSDERAEAAIVFGDPDWSDYDLTLEAMKVTGPGHGIEVVFHQQKRDTFGWFGVGVFENKGSELYFRVNGNGSRKGDTHPDNWKWEGIDRGRWYPIKVKVRKGQLDCFLDESRLFRESFAGLTHGRVGLRTGSIRARFRQIKVTAPDGKVLWEGLPDPSSFTPLSILQADGTESKGWTGGLASWSWNPRTRELTFDPSEYAGPIFSGRTYRDFELRCRIRHSPDTNSGIHFRRPPLGAAPQCDITGDLTGSLWMNTTLASAPRSLVAKAVKKNDFNEYVVRCVGKHVTLRVNGVTTIDGDFPSIPFEGQVGFEPSRLGPMTVRDLQVTDLGSVPIAAAAAGPARPSGPGFVMDGGRPTLVAAYRASAPLLDGVIGGGEYGDPVEVDFTPGSRWGTLLSGLPDPATSKAPEDLSVTLRAAYTGDTLFLAFHVRDDSVDAPESHRDQPFKNDAVEVFLDGDRAPNDFTLTPLPPNGSREGFQLVADAAGHRYTVARDFTNGDWTAAAKPAEGGYVVEFAIPLALIDTEDGPGRMPAGPGSLIHFGMALDDKSPSAPIRASYAYVRANPSVAQPFFGREAAWSLGIRLAPGGSAAAAPPAPPGPRAPRSQRPNRPTPGPSTGTTTKPSPSG